MSINSIKTENQVIIPIQQSKTNVSSPSPLSFLETTALSILKKVTVLDIGTGDVGANRFKLSKMGYVYSDTPKVEVLGRDSKSAQQFVDEIIAICKMPSFSKTKIIINMTAWARNPNEKDAELIRLLQEVQKQYLHITVNVLTQEQEAELSQISLASNLKFQDPIICVNHGITPENTIQLEGGKGSIQSAAILPKQTEEMSGTWGNEQLKQGKTLEQTTESLKEKLKNDMLDQIPATVKNVAMQGIFAVALQDKEVMEFLKIKGDEVDSWKKGILPKKLSDVIAALQAKITKGDNSFKQATLRIADTLAQQTIDAATSKEQLAAAAKAQAMGVPAALALASLIAFRDKYGEGFNILNKKEANELFNTDGTRTLKEAKTSGAHGAAVKYFASANKQFSRQHKVAGRVLKSLNWNYQAKLIRA